MQCLQLDNYLNSDGIIPVKYMMARFEQPPMVPRAPPIIPPANIARGPSLSLYKDPVTHPAVVYLEY